MRAPAGAPAPAAALFALAAVGLGLVAAPWPVMAQGGAAGRGVAASLAFEPRYGAIRELRATAAEHRTAAASAGPLLPGRGAARASGPQTQGHGTVVRLTEGGAVSMEVFADREAFSTVEVDYYPLDESPLTPEVSVLLDGVYPFRESRRMALPVFWEQDPEDAPAGTFPRDRYGDELAPAQRQVRAWHTATLRDPDGLYAEPFVFRFAPGRTRLTLTSLQGPLLVGAIRLTEPRPVSDFAGYRARPEPDASGSSLIRIEAEHVSLRTSTSIARWRYATPRPGPTTRPDTSST